MLFIALVIILGMLPGITWLLFFLEEDTRPEPLRLIIFAFLAGIIVTFFVFLALKGFEFSLYQLGIQNVVLDQSVRGPFTFTDITILFGLAFFEEVGKFLAIYFGIRWRTEFDQPVDVMIYLIVGALGFATIENIAANFDAIHSSLSLGDIIRVTVIRFIGAALLHCLSSATVGYYWARGLLVQKPVRYVIFGLLVGTTLHAMFNYLILITGPILYPTLFLVVVAFFIFVDFEELKQVDTLPMSGKTA